MIAANVGVAMMTIMVTEEVEEEEVAVAVGIVDAMTALAVEDALGLDHVRRLRKEEVLMTTAVALEVVVHVPEAEIALPLTTQVVMVLAADHAEDWEQITLRRGLSMPELLAYA